MQRSVRRGRRRVCAVRNSQRALPSQIGNSPHLVLPLGPAAAQGRRRRVVLVLDHGLLADVIARSTALLALADFSFARLLLVFY